MQNPYIFSLAIVLGFATLVYGADKFVHGASTIARFLGISPLIIGLTIVALGTSAPEVFTSATAAFAGSPGIAIGNVLGSNIANIGLVLGCTALLTPMHIPRSLMKLEIPALLIVSVASFGLLLDSNLSRLDGLILLAMLLLFCHRLYHSNEVRIQSELEEESDIAEFLTHDKPLKCSMFLLAGLVLMVAGSYALVWGARSLALELGVSELIVGLTIVAIGTSLPELATSITSALKGHHELAIGNVVGSNIFNLLLVLPVPAFISPVTLEPAILQRDFPAMLVATLLLSIIIFLLLPRSGSLGRASGAVFILFYLAYTALLLFQPA